MNFNIGLSDTVKVSDHDLYELLYQVYVSENYCDPKRAAVIFEATAVRARGQLFVAYHVNSTTLAGIVIIVPPHSEAIRVAQKNEAELHLLAVNSQYRQQGLGKLLIKTAIQYAQSQSYLDIVLWTQSSMHIAQALYQSFDFVRCSEFSRNGRDFIVYTKKL